MPTGVVLFPSPQAANVVDDVVSQARRAYELGVRQVWLAQQFDHDAIALAGLVGAAVPGLGVGTCVVPINRRHPLIVASLAQTAQAASHGNFSLGLCRRHFRQERLGGVGAVQHRVLRALFVIQDELHGDRGEPPRMWD
jgi:alkanesulfonate monooxygenase SsuD/methylene tetrahydromethanopterin reductase-like flavin-dependent oxidoreductase (luciferase family)